jgi:hypothetical protein
MNDTVPYWKEKSKRQKTRVPRLPRAMVRGKYVTRQLCYTCGSDQFFRPLNNLAGYPPKLVKVFMCTGCKQEILMVFATKVGV